jgi:hypothetical protein
MENPPIGGRLSQGVLHSWPNLLEPSKLEVRMADVITDGKRYSIIKSETFVIPEGSTTLLTEVDDLKLSFTFVTSSDKQLRVEPSLLSSKELSFLLHNFSNSLGSSFSTGIGQIDGQPLVVAMMVHAIGEASIPPRSVAISYLLEEAE